METDKHPAAPPWFVLVAGWPGSGKTTLAAALAAESGLPLLSKDEIKEALMDGLGRPETVAQSRRLGRAAVLALLRVATRCPGAVLDSTWFDYALPLARRLPGRLIEVHCTVPLELARSTSPGSWAACPPSWASGAGASRPSCRHPRAPEPAWIRALAAAEAQ